MDPSETNRDEAGVSSFEDALAQLELIVDRLEGGDLELEAALASFEQGVARSEDGRSFERSFSMREPGAANEEAGADDQTAEEAADLDFFEGEAEVFADAEPIGVDDD